MAVAIRANVGVSGDSDNCQPKYESSFFGTRFGFVETLTHEKEIFFHFSNVEGKAEKLEVGMEVEYTIFNREKGGKVSAEGVKVLGKGSIAPLKAKEEVFNGKVVRPLRSVNPDQDDYCGLIQVKTEEGKGRHASY